jgi:hypothetical protein
MFCSSGSSRSNCIDACTGICTNTRTPTHYCETNGQQLSFRVSESSSVGHQTRQSMSDANRRLSKKNRHSENASTHTHRHALLHTGQYNISHLSTPTSENSGLHPLKNLSHPTILHRTPMNAGHLQQQLKRCDCLAAMQAQQCGLPPA